MFTYFEKVEYSPILCKNTCAVFENIKYAFCYMNKKAYNLHKKSILLKYSKIYIIFAQIVYNPPFYTKRMQTSSFWEICNKVINKVGKEY